MSAQQILLNVLGNKCLRCGSQERLQLHHKDRDRNNNDLANIELLCRLCHLKEHGRISPSGRYWIKVVQVGNSLKATIPKEIVDQLNLKKGDAMKMWVDEDYRVIMCHADEEKGGR